MYPWGNTSTAQAAATHAVGNVVYSGACRGTVVSVDGDTMEIIWDDSDNDSTIRYPIDAPYLRKAMPWELT